MILVSSRFVPVKSEEELKRYYDAGLLYFNCSMTIPREQEWVGAVHPALTFLVDDYRRAQARTPDDVDEADIIPEDWGYLVEEDVVEGDSPNEKGVARSECNERGAKRSE